MPISNFKARSDATSNDELNDGTKNYETKTNKTWNKVEFKDLPSDDGTDKKSQPKSVKSRTKSNPTRDSQTTVIVDSTIQILDNREERGTPDINRGPSTKTSLMSKKSNTKSNKSSQKDLSKTKDGAYSQISGEFEKKKDGALRIPEK